MDNLEHRDNKRKASLSIKKSLGITNKILEMVEDDKYCPEIIQQIDATIGLLMSSKKTLLKGHLNHCLEENLKEDKEKAVRELIKIFDLK